jgi:hypothetical protein
MKCRTLPLETELLALTGEDRDARIVARHLGFDGGGGANFQRIGNEFGLTRERVRQIVLIASKNEVSLPVDLPAFDLAIATVAASVPARACEVEAKLRSAGLTSGLFRLEGIVNVARLLGRTLPFSMRALRTDRFAVDRGFPAFNDIVAAARHNVRRSGMAAVCDLVRSGLNAEESRREMSIVEAVLVMQKGFRWLDQSTGWFWFSGVSGNLALRRIRKMLSVAVCLTLADLRAGLARMRNELPPDEVLIQFCLQAPGITVEGNKIRASSRIARARVLNKTEQDIFGILAEHNGRMPNSELICRANDLGIKRPTFYQCVSHSPIVSRYGRHYGLIGSTTPRATLQ